jgi:hypothetical protein
MAIGNFRYHYPQDLSVSVAQAMLGVLKPSIPNKRAEKPVWVVEIVRKEPGHREFS